LLIFETYVQHTNFDFFINLQKSIKIFTMKNADDFFDKTSKLADQAEERIREAFDKAKKSDAYAKISDAMEQAGEAVEKKIEELKQKDIPGKAEKFRDQAEARSESVIEKVKAFGARVGDEVDDMIDSLKGKKKG